MPLATPISLTDTYDQARIKMNALRDTVNDILLAAPVDDVFTLNEPVNDGDVLIYDSMNQVFTNESLSDSINDVLVQNSIISIPKSKLHFNALMRGLY